MGNGAVPRARLPDSGPARRRLSWRGLGAIVPRAAVVAILTCGAGTTLFRRAPAADAAPSATGEWLHYHADASGNPAPAGGQYGAVAWRSPKINDQIFALSVAGSRVYATGTGAKPAVYALNRDNGQAIWARQVDNLVMTQPIVADGRVYIGTGDNTYFFKNGVKYFGTGSNSIYALDAGTGAVVWRLKVFGAAMPTPIDDHGTLYWTTGGRKFLAIDAASGKILWSLNLPSFASMSSPVQDGSLVIFGGSQTYAEYAVNIQTHKIAWQHTFDTWDGLKITNGVDDCPPALANGRIFCTGSASLNPARPTGGQIRQFAFALDAQTGKLLWRHNQGAGFRPPFFAAGVPMAQGNVVYVESPGNKGVQVLNARTGKLIWMTKLDAMDRSAPVLDGKNLFIVDDKGSLYQIDAATGKLLHRLVLGGAVGNVGIVLANGTIYVPNAGGYVDAVPERALTSASTFNVKPLNPPIVMAAGAASACGA